MKTPLSNRKVKYVRYEFHGEEEAREGPLLHFVYDIPYFDACGVFPPFHLANEIFSMGARGGGMSPGANWEPFTVSPSEYESLVQLVRMTPIDEIRPHARYTDFQFILDPRFDHIQTRTEWLRAVSAEHLEAFQRRIDELYRDNA